MKATEQLNKNLKEATSLIKDRKKAQKALDSLQKGYDYVEESYRNVQQGCPEFEKQLEEVHGKLMDLVQDIGINLNPEDYE